MQFSVDDLCDFFSGVDGNKEPVSGDPYYLGEESYEEHKFYWRHIETEEAVKALLSNKSEAVGMDGLPSAWLLKALPVVLSVVTHIFNHSLTMGVFPNT